MRSMVEGCHRLRGQASLAGRDTPPSGLRPATSPCRGGLFFRMPHHPLRKNDELPGVGLNQIGPLLFISCTTSCPPFRDVV